MNKEKLGYLIITLVLILSIIGILLIEPIAQDVKYHLFEDQRIIFGIPHFWNVISNLPFLVVGVMGVIKLLYANDYEFGADVKMAYLLFFFSVSLVAFGSGYYHLSPNNETLVWDRLPMTIAFMALFTAIISESGLIKHVKFILWPLVFFGVFSVFYWHLTESNDNGDLRLYILVQFVPIIIIPLILIFFRYRFSTTKGYWLLLSAYVLAKLFEHFDAVIYDTIILLSGHSLKHIAAAIGVYLLLNVYKKRQIVR